ncbi:phosphatidylglycerol lysyltransferase domain-containing protein [Aliiroseovarius sp. S2029]|uniref:phosphatidylglycerol lysyltransferase domain-containing protein n=1 Tax=Aliiroseovarius sp. S2029 TaxID=2936988 RepID=UPI0020BFBCBA|nr:phosphatidylglycerol lysyltransferase domain-containing protein [Aliiroseovarius sp. S2029]MCK8483971.1 phosphatidylglycerol lysyltransferase domain-containing protein [Aliiroseovarius sp. S2029]
MVASLLRPRLLSGVRLPPLRAVGAFLVLAVLDMVAAGAALWVLLPAGCDISPLQLIAAYMLALGAGLISGTPGGMGPFELTLLAALPTAGPEPLLAAILAFRAVYFALPALLAAALTIRGPRAVLSHRRGQANQPATTRLRPPFGPHLPTHVAQALRTAPRAEAGLLRHGRFSLIERGNATPVAMGTTSGQSLIVLSDPMDPALSPDTFLSELEDLARRGFHAPFLYKIGGRIACAARRAGWRVLPLAREATLDPQRFTLDGSDKRQLRRKLRQADKAGVVIQPGGVDLPFADMDRIAARWSATHGGERGFSMGVWSPATLPFAQVFLAYYHGRLVGFLTLHANANEHALDLMRIDPSAPDGTMHALVTQAIAAAKADGIARFSLAAVPLGACRNERTAFQLIRRVLNAACGADGLRQFKSAFSPHWETLYAAAPSAVALGIGALDVMREIHQTKAR